MSVRKEEDEIPLTDMTSANKSLEDRLRRSLEAVLIDYTPLIELSEVEVRRPSEDDFNVAPPHMFSEVLVSICYRTQLSGSRAFSIAGTTLRLAQVLPEEMAATLRTNLPPPDRLDATTRDQIGAAMRMALDASRRRASGPRGLIL